MSTVFALTDSPIGELCLIRDDEGLRGLYMQDHRGAAPVDPGWLRDDAAFTGITGQLDRYFAGELTDFDLPLAPRGTPFQLRVWAALSEIPYGETISYGELARYIGHPSAARAVGLANGRNPVAVIVPCHRVIGADGSLTGYGGGLERKRFLLDLEAGVLTLAT